MGPVRFTRKTEARGYATGTPFDDTPDGSNLAESLITKIMVYHSGGIDGLQVYYRPDNARATLHGSGGSGTEIVLGPDEVITMVQGSLAGAWIAHLKFTTNKRTVGPLGNPTSIDFTWSAAENVSARLAPQMALLSFSGNQSGYISKLQATFAQLPGRNNRSHENLKYEEQTPIKASSQFATHLMSQSVTLCVGPDSTKFYPNEAAICQLPFFKAALQGGFKEAVDKTINMAHDDPDTVSALIEFLYTGKYTYTYDPTKTKQDRTKDSPVGTLAEGLFHVGVSAAASKYDCQPLKDSAWKNFQAVLDDLGDEERLKLWKAAYHEGFQFPESEDSEETNSLEMREWARVLFKDHRDEMETAVREDPQFACDFFRLATAGMS